jgi:hypothetical protein
MAHVDDVHHACHVIKKEVKNGVHVTRFCHVITGQAKEWCTRNVNLIMPCQQQKSEEEACTRHFGASSLARIERLKADGTSIIICPHRHGIWIWPESRGQKGTERRYCVSTSPRHVDWDMAGEERSACERRRRRRRRTGLG